MTKRKPKFDVSRYVDTMFECGCDIHVYCHEGRTLGMRVGCRAYDGKRAKYQALQAEYWAAGGREALDKKIAAECIRRGHWTEWPYNPDRWPVVSREELEAVS